MSISFSTAFVLPYSEPIIEMEMKHYQIYYQRTDGSRNGAYATVSYPTKKEAEYVASACNWADKGKVDYQVRELPKDHS